MRDSVIVLAPVVASGLRKPDLIALSLSGVSIVLLFAVWWLEIRTQMFVHKLFVDGQINELEQGSTLYRVLQQLSTLMTGLRTALIAFGFALAAAGVLLYASRR